MKLSIAMNSAESLNYKSVYVTEDAQRDGQGDIYNSYFSDRNEAMKDARDQWEHLTARERAARTINVFKYALFANDAKKVETDEDAPAWWFQDLSSARHAANQWKIG